MGESDHISSIGYFYSSDSSQCHRIMNKIIVYQCLTPQLFLANNDSNPIIFLKSGELANNLLITKILNYTSFQLIPLFIYRFTYCMNHQSRARGLLPQRLLVLKIQRYPILDFKNRTHSQDNKSLEHRSAMRSIGSIIH